MPDHGYCTVDDVRRVLQKTPTDFDSKATGEDSNQLVVDAITGLTEWINKTTKKHWYVSGGITEDTHGIIPSAPASREDEHDFQTSAAYVDEQETEPFRVRENSDTLLESAPKHYSPERERDLKQLLRISFGDYEPGVDPGDTTPAYTRIELNRKDVQDITNLMVVNSEGGFDDWLANKTGGVGNAHRGDDWWVRVNNRGISQLNIDVQALDADIASLSSAVYAAIDYGGDELPMTVRRGVAHLAASDIVVYSE